MKTYKQTIEKPCLVIQHDTDADSPRNWDNLGYFITVDRQYYSPDKNEMIQNVIRSTGEKADNKADHIKLIKDELESESNIKVLAIYPITKYEHTGVEYSIGTINGFDNSNNGFYIVTDKTAKLLGTEPEDFVKVINQELKTYNAWANGEVYGFTLHGEDSELLDSCWGFYDLDDIKDHLPAEYQKEDLSDYLVSE